jgi:hypothetical protein
VGFWESSIDRDMELFSEDWIACGSGWVAVAGGWQLVIGWQWLGGSEGVGLDSSFRAF